METIEEDMRDVNDRELGEVGRPQIVGIVGRQAKKKKKNKFLFVDRGVKCKNSVNVVKIIKRKQCVLPIIIIFFTKKSGFLQIFSPDRSNRAHIT